MSKETDNEFFVRTVQGRLGLVQDGWAGRKTLDALEAILKPTTGVPVVVSAPSGSPVDDRSEKNIKTLTPETQAAARKWLLSVRQAGIKAVIICGTRTFAEQEEIYAQGRTKPGKVVSNARAGSSVHNYGKAWDFVVFEGLNDKGGTGEALWESPDMRKAGAIAIEQGLDWGGAWKSFADIPHIQLPGLSVSELRKSMPKGYIPA